MLCLIDIRLRCAACEADSSKHDAGEDAGLHHHSPTGFAAGWLDFWKALSLP